MDHLCRVLFADDKKLGRGKNPHFDYSRYVAELLANFGCRFVAT
jgi:hypothetical protein